MVLSPESGQLRGGNSGIEGCQWAPLALAYRAIVALAAPNE